jgi:hypothetical protein
VCGTAAGGTRLTHRELAKLAAAKHESREVLRAQLQCGIPISPNERGKVLSLRCCIHRRYAQCWRDGVITDWQLEMPAETTEIMSDGQST